MRNPPLGLYVHIPWCVQKCPYCDFNSHTHKDNTLPEQEYIQHLLNDLAIDSQKVVGRNVESIFIGGGTPSVFSTQGIANLLAGIRERVDVADNAEITLEANPGTVEAGRFQGYQQAGVNRISIGVQSLQHDQLKKLGRIHNTQQAIAAIEQAKHVGLNSFNVDLMHGLPGQTIQNALDDLTQVIALDPPHLSWYQLTIEPNTLFYSQPPTLPDDDVLWDIQEQGHALLEQAGYKRYEISGYSKPAHQCKHNLNYWRYGDYLGIGCGAHGKITHASSTANNDQKNSGAHRFNDVAGEASAIGLENSFVIERTVKVKHPRGYMDLAKPYSFQNTVVPNEDRAFEFFMNQFRLREPCLKANFSAFTGIELTNEQHAALANAESKGLIESTDTYWMVTDLGHRYLNSLLAEFV